jgi:putative FmdB family regulatory protein
MPIYVNHCERCKERFERLVPMSANSSTATYPSCGAADARVLKPGGVLAVTEQLMDSDFRLPRTIRDLASKTSLLDAGSIGWSWWTYTARFRKPT